MKPTNNRIAVITSNEAALAFGDAEEKSATFGVSKVRVGNERSRHAFIAGAPAHRTVHWACKLPIFARPVHATAVLAATERDTPATPERRY